MSDLLPELKSTPIHTKGVYKHLICVKSHLKEQLSSSKRYNEEARYHSSPKKEKEYRLEIRHCFFPQEETEGAADSDNPIRLIAGG